MRTRARHALAAVAVLVATAGCKDYFTGPKLNVNPNSPSTSGPTPADQLFVGSQGLQFAYLTSDPNRAISAWMQHMAGTGRQWLTIDAGYQIDENTFSFAPYYGTGGLVDIRRVVDAKRKIGDLTYTGIAQAFEALVMAQAADIWGDIPFRQAAQPDVFPQPKLDPQQQVYGDLQILLDSAIANMSAGKGNGPGSFDLVYGGDPTLWIPFVHTLKARLYMHTAERIGTAAYQSAITEALKGITSSANDYATYQSTTTGEENQWFQFRRERATDIGSGKYLVDLLKSRGDPRLTLYLSPGPSANGVFIGASPGQEDDGTIAWLSSTRGSAGFHQPLVTWAETQLILAEAYLKTGQTGLARAALNTERSAAGLANETRPDAQLFTAIMEEKYVALFQNIETWSDYKRTCYPNLAPSGGATFIPGRLFYGSDERNVNKNVPDPASQPSNNWNDPPTAIATDGTACLGQNYTKPHP